MSLSAEEICASMPSAYVKIVKKVRKLKFVEAPDYKDYIRKLSSVLTKGKNSVKHLERAFDWNRSHTKRSR